MSPGPAAQDASAAKKAPGRAIVLAPELAAERAYGLASPPGTILPSDTLLGPLEDLRGSEASRSAAIVPATAFLEGLVKGRLPKEGITPSRLDLVTLMAGPALGEARPREWRLGRLKLDGKPGAASALAAFTLAWPLGEGEKLIWSMGELGLRLEAGAWLVESLSLEAPPFVPSQGG